MAVRVGQSQIDDLLGVANPPSETHIFKGDTFDDLESIIAKVRCNHNPRKQFILEHKIK